MSPRPLLLTAAATLAVVHVVGVLFARPLLRPAELLATLCLLICAVRYALVTDRHPAPAGEEGPADARSLTGAGPVLSKPAAWGPAVAAAVLVGGAALTVPPAPSQNSGLQILSPEQYDNLVWQAQVESLIPVTAALLFVLVLLTTGDRRAGTGRVLAGTGIAAGVLVVGYAVLRLVMIEFGTDEVTMISTDGEPPTPSLSAGAVALLPLLLALAALALAVVTIARRRPPAAIGALLLTAVALIWIDAAIRAAPVPYAVRDFAGMFSPDLLPPTETLPQPMEALSTGLRLTAAILLIAGMSRRQPATAVHADTST